MTVNSNILVYSTGLLEYLNQINFKEHDILQEISNYNKNHKLGNMQFAKCQKDFMVWLSNLIQVKKYLEIGVFTGYSSTSMALSLPEDGQITACDIDINFTNTAKDFWKRAQVEDKINLYLQPALITLEELINNNDFFDLALIDADKLLIPEYVDKCFKLIKTRGVILIDNIFSRGRVVNVSQESSLSVRKLDEFNKNLKNDKRFTSLTLPIGDGLSLLLKN